MYVVVDMKKLQERLKTQGRGMIKDRIGPEELEEVSLQKISGGVSHRDK